MSSPQRKHLVQSGPTSSDTRTLPTLPGLSEGEKPGGLANADPPPRTAKQRGGGATFSWRDVTFGGSTLFDDAALTAVVADLMTAAATLTDLEIARTRLTRFYVDAGYVNSGALLPAQNVAGGTVRFDIIEGRLQEVRPLGAAIGVEFGPGGQLHPDYATDRLAKDAGEPLNVEELRRKFGQLLEDPMIARLDGRLLPGTKPGEALLELEVEPVRPFALAVSLNNAHSVSNGAFGVDADAQIRNLTGRGDFTISRLPPLKAGNRRRCGLICPSWQVICDPLLRRLIPDRKWLKTRLMSLSDVSTFGTDLRFS